MKLIKLFYIATVTSIVGSSMVLIYNEPSNLLAQRTLTFGFSVLVSLLLSKFFLRKRE